MSLRRAAALLLVAAATVLTPATASAATSPAGLYGSADPTYDGVWRQGYALLALHTAGVTPSAAAVDWLTGQQCADGGFPSFRADTAKPCVPKAEDTNATGIALQALAVLGGHSATVNRGTAWLTAVQNPDGGWPYNPGNPSDPDSTAVVVGALAAADHDPLATRSRTGRTPFDALHGFQFGCAAKPADRGSYGYPMNGKLSVNAKATADAVRAAEGAGFVVTPPPAASAPAAPACGDGRNAADAYARLAPKAGGAAGAVWLAGQLTAGGGHLTALTPGADKPTPDYGTTADAVVALAAGGDSGTAKAAYTWLAGHSTAWSHGNPAALSQLILAAHATGADPHNAAGADLVRQLTNLGPAPAAGPAKASVTTRTDQAAHKSKKSSSGPGTWLIVGVIFVASIGFGFLLSARRRQS
ncbi:prenyltransferase/squalene oxidase repeat-containing protein [Actinacidiphila acididurans]|uniref:Terpene cyclase/mutase family protein n=1 Tax=Actinacidiphila acididurans TaxID=2784346 RepID=A0ABS2U795_9ACTN|nr:prenyltransferase/squalene oxidase repeat-containing protein [Actinacidiphila acididurans]MBM9510641.1 terpene cyclase/mutase family protein [Actinacidiphila acididurans]